MTDRAKIIKGLECCSAMSGDECQECPYGHECRDTDLPYGIPHLAADVLALLKEQEPMPMLEVEDDDLYAWSPEDVSYYCPRPECGKEISYDYHFCPYCGQAVKLNEIN